jgi:two-component system cell cycle sensor histidine kinase/response regulator CckA
MSNSGQIPELSGSFFLSKRLLLLPVGLLTAIVVAFTSRPKLAHDLFSSAYLPHLYCYLGNSRLAWTHVTADGLIGLSYFAISLSLAYLIYRGKGEVPFHGMFLAFGLFIIACGSTHFVEAVTVWVPVYALSAAIKVFTALASVATAAFFPLVIPDIISLVRRARASEERRLLLEMTLIERDAAQEELKQAKALLEERVLERTMQIALVKEALEAEVLERRSHEEVLRQSEERFRKVFRSSPLPITISTEADGRYLDVNDSFLTILGRDRNSVVGHTTSELGFWVDKQDRVTLLERLSKEGRIIGLATKIRVAAEEVREASISAERIELDGQLCVLAITQDMTETKRVQAQFLQAQKMEAIGRMAGGIAHDFNNILGVIIGYSELSKQGIDPELPVAKYLSEIESATKRGANLTRQLLAFSRKQVISPRVLDLNFIVNDLSKMLTRVIGEDISFSFHPSVPLGSVLADGGQIEQILMNLVVNARDAMPDGGEIRVETANVELDKSYSRKHEPVPPGPYVMLIVRDTGCGMDETTKARIFEPFFTTKAPGKGTGLGLATVYGIVKQSGGYIWAYSESGHGTSFKLYFPQVQTAAAESVISTTVGTEAFSGSETVLLVEDEHIIRNITMSSLQSAGYTVLEADKPLRAIQIVESYAQPIHLLLTDVIMPEMSGVKLSKRLKSMRPDLKVVFISGYGGDELAKQMSLEPDAVLIEKPFSRKTLLARIHAVLHKIGHQ